MVAIEVRRALEGDARGLEGLAAVRAQTEQELNPGDPPAPAAELAAELFVPWSRQQRLGWLATVDGEPAGELCAVLEPAPNDHRVDVEWLAVVPAHRRRGVADALVRAALADEELAGRTTVTFWAPVLPDEAGLAYAERCGASMRMAERCSRLRVDDLPEDLLDEWIAEGRSRRDGYRLVQWVGRVPQQHLGLMATVHRAMQDMPTDDLDLEVPEHDEDDIRSFDESAAARGQRAVITAAVGPGDEPAGFSALFVSAHRPQLAAQGDTGVLAEHRGHGLGRWLKAENLRHALAVEPRIEVVETYNAESNPWMLDINVAMGFRSHVAIQAWQGHVDDVLAAVVG